MKKISKVAALLAASALLFGGMFLSCSDSDDSSSEKPASGPTSGGKGDSSGDGEGEGSTGAEYVNALWDFKTMPSTMTNNTYTTSADLTSHAAKSDDSKDVAGATLKIIANSDTGVSKDAGLKWKSESESQYGLYTSAKTSGITVASPKVAAGLMELTIDKAAIVTIVASGNGTVADYRLVSVVNASGTSVGGKDGLASEDLKTIEVNNGAAIDAGTYKIYVNGARIHSIEATSLKSAATFTVTTDTSTANNLATLGIVGTSVESSDKSVATAAIAEGKIAITSVKAGDASITVKNAADKSATIAVSVSSSGEITPTIAKFTRSAPSAEVTKKASSATATDGAGTVTWDGLTDLEWSTDGSTWAGADAVKTTISTFAVAVTETTASVTGLPAGTYYVRGKASDDYEATESTTVTVGNSAAAKTTDSWDLSKRAVENFTVNGYTYSGTGTDYTYTAATALSTTAAILAEDYVYAGASGNLNLTISKYSGTGVGNSKAGVTTAPDWNATSNNKPGNSVQWKTHDKGLIIKRDGIKISGVKGSVKLKITFGITSSKDENNRFLEVTVGSGETVKTSNPAKSTDPATYSVDVEGGTEGVDVYIGASNELYLQSITIE